MRNGIRYGVAAGLILCTLLSATCFARQPDRQFGRHHDPVLAWNQVMLDANAIDSTLADPDNPGPTSTSRAFAIVSVAMYDAFNSISGRCEPYLSEVPGYSQADPRAAVGTAAYVTLNDLYPQQADRFDALYAECLAQIKPGDARDLGVELGQIVAADILAVRTGDGSEADMIYIPGVGPGFHQVDPINSDQGFHAPLWGYVDTFVIGDIEGFLSPPPPSLDSFEYALAYQEVMTLGGDNADTLRTAQQTETGIFWAYDGTPGLGKPPRLYNQIVRVIARDRRNSTADNARLFALVNLAMADAGIQAWYTKYTYEYWRPIVAIRAGEYDGNDLTIGDAEWKPLGAPFSNGPAGAPNFTPPFPAYTSGHATFGAAALWTVARFYGTDRIHFKFMSDEFNGITRDQNGNVRPVVIRHYNLLSDAILENALSRIYLGIHWRFDAEQGIASGMEIADYVYENVLQKRRPRR
jgi:hypothetical protein